MDYNRSDADQIPALAPATGSDCTRLAFARFVPDAIIAKCAVARDPRWLAMPEDGRLRLVRVSGGRAANSAVEGLSIDEIGLIVNFHTEFHLLRSNVRVSLAREALRAAGDVWFKFSP
jgi:hypothetical protein